MSKKEKQNRQRKKQISSRPTQDPPIQDGYDQLYDVVISSLVLDIAPRTNDEFTAVIRRVGGLVKVGGSLFLYLAENGPLYTVGDHTFESFPVDSDLDEKAMEMANFGRIETTSKFYSEPYTYFFVKGIRQ